ncbi:hypothetical protein CALVIDRAFT_595964 [Calocera viscosa TUFC12733]|uniref:Jacalin-type lectin domain-containing protein n=1 Tax=Calocera viscosa (strain TUFC12733) TaxID=1330018 RepID=A0A167Q2U2_CALVF|nr:hypothetical protein CALVIDRAFT_595964 [Calocera viscosa TUFC12733]
MSSGIVELVEAFGINKGKHFNDHTLDPVRIRSISLYEGWLVDSLEVTYVLKDGSTKTANHLGSSKANVTISFSPTELLVGVTGKTGLPGYYENLPYLNSVSFVILDTETGKVRVAGPYGVGGPATAYHGTVFTVVGEIKAFSGLELTEKSDPDNALTLVFPESQVLSVKPYINPGGPIRPVPQA